MPLIYHIITPEEWEKAKAQGFYEAPSLATEGFIHCSEAGQVAGVLERYYAGKTGLLKLVIRTDKLTSPLRYDIAPSLNEPFPHLYGPLNLSAVSEVLQIE